MSEVILKAPPVKGFKVASVHCGLKPAGELDFVLIVSETACVGTGSFTTNPFMSESIRLNQMRLESNPNSIRAVVIHTGCANAFTGQQGQANAAQVARWVAERLGCEETAVLVLSSGEVGTQLPMDKLRRGVDLAFEVLGDDWDEAAKAINNDHHQPNISWRYINGVHILGIVSNEVCVLLSDVAIDHDLLDESLYWAITNSFDRNVMNGTDTPEIAVLMLSNRASGVSIQGEYQDTWSIFGLDVNLVCDDLAWDQCQDVNGATKIIDISVMSDHPNWYDSTRNWLTCHKIAHTIACSTWLRSRFHHHIVDWAEIVAVAGQAGFPLPLEKLCLWIMPGRIVHWPARTQPLLLYGKPAKHDADQAIAIAQSSTFTIRLHCGKSGPEAVFRTTDLSPEYITLNSSYRH